jgi:predicted regulator of Ras-like GTPase activity (Roadblock/LC7/MglB family)
MKDIILRREDIERFTTTLTKLVKKAHVSLTVLIHKDGHLLASCGTEKSVDTIAFSALISANFSSTMAIAQLIDEREFSTQLHAGHQKSIFISLVDNDTFLASVFDNSVNVNSVRVYTEEYTTELAASLELLYNNEFDVSVVEQFAVPLDQTIQLNRDEFNQRATSPKAASKAAQKASSKPPEGEISVETTSPSPQQAEARVLPHTARTRKHPTKPEQSDVFYIDLPEDYYTHRIRKKP